MYSTPVAIRLVGVRVDNLIEKDTMQLSLFDNKENKRQEKLDKVIDELKNKYGYNKITRAGKMNAGDILKLKNIKK